ncbi:MAG TPA: DUF899 domain-containing protein [Acidimicrobiales bacterium]|jgi:predicted dithiol-disulfide oxidoreductase (DUF899 family)|nr:DUF899 domain-containing protein [Acidimicrobiales bacterium]
MSLPPVVSRQEWLEARKALLGAEKEMTRARDALNTRRRELPMVKIEKEYRFEGLDGPTSLLGLFNGRRQLIVRHFMFDPSWDEGCPSCTAASDEVSAGLLAHLHARDTSFVAISRAPLEKIETYRRRKGWRFPWYSSFGSDFNYDFHVTLDESVAPVEFNYRNKAELQAVGMGWLAEGSSEQPGHSIFLRDGDNVFHTYSMFARGAEMLGGSYYFLDLTALGRQEEWEKPAGRIPQAHGARPDFSG